MNEQLVDYFQKGMERGYSIEHIKKVLINNGHSPMDVGITATYVRQELTQGTQGSIVPPPRNQPIIETKKFHPLIIVVLVIAGIALIASLVTLTNSPTGATVFEDTQEKTTQIEEITKIDEKIEVSKQKIDDFSTQLLEKEMTIEEKNKIILQQMEEITSIQENIEQQRQGIRDLLLDLLNSIIQRSVEDTSS